MEWFQAQKVTRKQAQAKYKNKINQFFIRGGAHLCIKVLPEALNLVVSGMYFASDYKMHVEFTLILIIW